MARITVLLLSALWTSQAIAVEPPEDMQKFLDAVKECHGKYSTLSNEIVQYSIVHDMALQDETNADARCFVECTMIKMGLLQEDASFDVEKAIASLADYQKHLHSKGKDLDVTALKEQFSMCASEDGEGTCMKSYKIVKCGLASLESKIKSL